MWIAFFAIIVLPAVTFIMICNWFWQTNRESAGKSTFRNKVIMMVCGGAIFADAGAVLLYAQTI